MQQTISDINELKLVPGQKMQIELATYTTLKTECSLVGYLKDRAIIITTPLVNGAPVTVSVGTQAAVRFFANQANSVCAFHAEVIHVAQAVFPHLYLSAPMLIELGEIRKAARARVDAPCSLYASDDAKPKAGTVLDLSTAGARVFSSDIGVESGSEIQIIVKFEILGLDKIMKIPAIVRSINFTAKGVQYGLQFADIKNDDKIALHAVVMSNI